jgi:hypothetical protein
MIKKIIVFFHRKKIVHSRTYEPAQFYKAIEVKGKHYIRVVQTNRPSAKGTIPMLDIPVNQVLGFRVLNSPFQKWLYSLIGKEPSNSYKLRSFNKK